MFKGREQQSLIAARTRALANAEERIEELSENLNISRHNNIVLLEKNKKLQDILNKIKVLLTSNTYNNKEILDRKLKELVDDYQSLN